MKVSMWKIYDSKGLDSKPARLVQRFRGGLTLALPAWYKGSKVQRFKGSKVA